MKHYLSPKIQVVEVRNNTVLCASETPAPARNMGVSIKNMGQVLGASWV